MSHHTHEKSHDLTVQNLNALIQDNLDAIEVLEHALPNLEDGMLQGEVRQMMDEHRQAAQRLQAEVRMHNETPETQPHAANALKESWQALWKGGGDKEIMLALRANERVAVDKLKTGLTIENPMDAMSEEGKGEYKKALAMELRHFRRATDLLRDMGASVDNDEAMGAMRNAAEHVHAAINMTGSGIEDFIKWVGSKLPGRS
jgi:hypothetical protein